MLFLPDVTIDDDENEPQAASLICLFPFLIVDRLSGKIRK